MFNKFTIHASLASNAQDAYIINK